jgi:hypothetical protein
LPEFYFTEAEVGKDPDQRNYVVSNQRIEATRFRPIVDLDEGIEELIKGYQVIRQNGYCNA